MYGPVHLCHVWLQFRLAYVSSESMVVGCGKLVWDARAIASQNLRSFKGIWLDAFVILPVPQVIINFYLIFLFIFSRKKKDSYLSIFVSLNFIYNNKN